MTDDADGRLIAIVDRTQHLHARLLWNAGVLVELWVPGAILRGAIVDDPLLGPAHELIADAGDHPLLTTMSAIDWARPTEIPAIAQPGRLPPGVGGAIMNILALLAQRAGIIAMRYAGPYPTSALWATLARSFRTMASEDEFVETFAERAAAVARDPMPILFVPAPHERIALPGGHVEVRDGVERVSLDGVVYARDHSVAILADDGEHTHAEIWFADARYARVATFSDDGVLVDGPHAIPACTDPNVGAAFPAELATALADLVADAVTEPLADAAREVVRARVLRWMDLGGHAARIAGDELHVHAAIWRVAAQGLPAVAFAIVEALAPVVTPLAAAALLR